MLRIALIQCVSLPPLSHPPPEATSQTMLRKKTVDLIGTQAFTQFDSIGRSLPDTPYKPATPVCSDPLKLGNVQER